MNVDSRFKHTMANMLNAQLSYHSWRSVRSANNVRKKWSEKYNLDLSFPWNARKLNNFIMMGKEEGLKAATLRSYISRLNKLQRVKCGMDITWTTESGLVLKGMEHMASSEGPRRVAITPFLLWKLKVALSKSSFKSYDRRVLWFVACIMWSACLRSSEILCATRKRFVRATTMLRGDVVYGSEGDKEFLVIGIKSPKEARNGNTITKVEVFRTGLFNCPIVAWNNLRNAWGDQEKDTEPLAQLSDGGLTREMFNSILRKLLAGVVDYDKHLVLSHSFRSGIATCLSRLGCNPETVMAQGRWSSASYMAYIKQGRTTRWSEQQKISLQLAEMVSNWQNTEVLIA